MQSISWTQLFPSEQTANDRILTAVGDDACCYDMQAIGDEYYSALDQALDELDCYCTGKHILTAGTNVMPEAIRAAIDHIDYRAIVESHALPKPTEDELAAWDARRKDECAQMQRLLDESGINIRLG